ncbi:MAG TPA: NlpC/P60 family protein [Gaiellaceae bacterium]|nr:NlpC/P60 family protein [Gaiellaceae bacterium]
MKESVGLRVASFATAVAVAAFAVAVALGSSRHIPDWAAPQIASVVSHGLMGATSVKSFHPNAALTRQTLSDLAFDLQQSDTTPPPPPPPTTTTATTTTEATTTAPAPGPTTDATTAGATTTTDATTTTATAPQIPDGSDPATMATLDRELVTSLGLLHSAGEFAQGARAAGIGIPNRFGTEVVARLLGLRINHPASQDYLELRPQDTATRAEAAYSAAQILGFGWLDDSWQIDWVKSAADSFALPQMTEWQKRILTVAFSKIGMPYIWGGTSDGPEAPFGVPSRGGYDCSGFVWRVYKLQSYPGEGDLASTIQGRTTYTMSVEVPASERIPLAKLQPADVIFFGSQGRFSSGAEIDHTAIYIGNGWFIQSSDEGVALAQLTGWYRKEFAWGRRPLREAGLEP